MVAYSFKQRFEAPIRAGTKTQTIRADRRRHARPGEQLQLYVGMRTRQCRLIAQPTCTRVVPVLLRLDEAGAAHWWIGPEPVLDHELDAWARADGFADHADMLAFWCASHDVRPGFEFRGVLIGWSP